MGRMSDIFIEMCEDLQTDEPTNEQITKWLQDRINEMQGEENPEHKENNSNNS